MAIVHESFTTAATATCNKPSGAAVGDVLIAAVGALHTAAATSTGWTLIKTVNLASAVQLTALYRAVDGSEGANFTFAGGTVADVGISRFSGVDPVAITTGTATSDADTPSATTTPASITTAVPGAMLVLCGHALRTGGTITDISTDPAMSEQWQTSLGDDEFLNLGTQTIAAAGATGLRTVTQTGTGTQYTLGVMFALAPAAATAPAGYASGLLLPV